MTEIRQGHSVRPGRAVRRGWLLLLACWACGGEPEARPADAGTGREVAAALPRAGPDSLVVHPYQTPPGFPLAFHTAVPESFQAEADLAGPGATVRFAWTTAGEQRDSAFVYVRVMDAGTMEGGAREIVRTAAERLRIPGDRTELEPRQVHEWAVVEYPIASVGTWGERVQGWVALGLREGRWFYVIVQAPVEAWPRFAPRAELILAEWRWAGPGGGPGEDRLGDPA
jgi:hypothetical protein